MEDGGWRVEGGLKFASTASLTALLNDLPAMIAKRAIGLESCGAEIARLPMSEIRNHRDLEAWQVAMDMVDVVYTVSAGFPPDERFGLTSQIRRAAVSVPSNIAEGQAYGLIRGCLHYFRIALGSLAEIDTQLEIAIRRNFTTRARCEELERLLTSSKRLTSALRRAKAVRLGVSLGSLGIIVATRHALL